MTFVWIDPVDIWIMVVPLLIYSFAFFLLHATSKIRDRKFEESRKKRLATLSGRPPK